MDRFDRRYDNTTARRMACELVFRQLWSAVAKQSPDLSQRDEYREAFDEELGAMVSWLPDDLAEPLAAYLGGMAAQYGGTGYDRRARAVIRDICTP